MSTKVLIADGLAPEGVEKLKATPGIELFNFSAATDAEMNDLLPTADILIVRSRTQVEKTLLEKAKHLKLVIRAGIGLDNVNVAAATDRGVVVMNAPTGNIVTTAEHTLALVFAVSRHVPQADATLRKGKWEKKKFQGNELRGKNMGLIGLGNIGKAVAERAIGLGMQAIGFDPYISEVVAAKHKIRLVTFEELLAQSDYLSVHVPLSEGTKHLLNKEKLLKMKKGAYLINCARGGIVDEAALMEVLDAGHLSGAALDVFEQEPLPADHPLLKRDDVVCTPHLGASTDEAQTQVSLEVADQVISYLRDGVLKNAINVPNITREQLQLMKPYITLCEKLGAFAAQVTPTTKVTRLKVHFEGAVSESPRDVLTLSVLKGFLTPLLSTPVNFVNARNLLKDRGIRVEESFEQDCADYASLVTITVEGDGPSHTCAGTLFGKSETRLTMIDGFAIDAVPDGYLLYTRNSDQPGVIGAMGSTIGANGVNIARMHLGRDPKKKEAIALINVDSELPLAGIEKLRNTKGMISVKQIKL